MTFSSRGPLRFVTRCVVPLAGLATVALGGLGGCRPDQAQGVAPPPPGLAVFHWSRPADMAYAPGTYAYVHHPAEVNDDAGVIESITATYDAALELLTWAVTISPRPDGGWHVTDGFWLVLSDGPMPRSLGGDTAQFIFDGSGPEPRVTAYVYNGQGGASSWSSGPGGAAAEPIMSSLAGQGFLSVDVVAEGDAVTMSFTADASVLNAFIPASSPMAHWKGVGFDNHIGLWFHPVTNVRSAYGPDGYLEQFDYDRTGWFDGTNFFTQHSEACCLAEGVCVDLMATLCIEQGGQPLGEGTQCDTTSCSIEVTDCCDEDKPVEIVMQFLGGGCDDSSHAQDPKKSECSGDDVLDPIARVLVTDRTRPDAKKAKVFYEGDVVVGDTFTVRAANAGEDKFKSSTYVHVLDLEGTPLQTMRIHTSCSQPLRTGDRFGSVQIVGCSDESTLPDCCKDDKPTALTFQWVGGGCDDSDHRQDDGKVACDGDSSGLPVIYAVANDEEDPTDQSDRVYFEGEVALDDIFTITAAAAGEDKFKSNTFVHLFDTAGTHVQSVGFHTSCSQPLVEGDRFGSLVLVGCGDDPDDPDPGLDCCEGDKPTALTMRWLGGGCANTVHAQNAGKATCVGDTGDLATVQVVANDEEDPTSVSDKVYFEGEVVLDGELTISAARAGRDKLDSSIFVHLYDAQGTPLQTIGFHTSCSQPLRLGDRFGGLELIGCGPDETSTETGPDCCEPQKPRALSFEYTGFDCNATTTTQDPSKVGCLDVGTLDGVVLIIGSADKSGEAGFTGELAVGDVFTLTASGEKLANETVIQAWDETGASLLQEVRFHTSCSQPLRIGDQFGAFRLVDCGEGSDTEPATSGVDDLEPRDECDAGKPVALTMRYVGAGCDVMSHDQDEKKVRCKGDPLMQPAVRIVVSDRRKLDARKTRFYFDDVVLLDDLFTFEAATANRRRLRGRTFVTILNVLDEPLQTIELHTSCSQPLRLGDQFGSLVLEGFFAEP